MSDSNFIIKFHHYIIFSSEIIEKEFRDVHDGNAILYVFFNCRNLHKKRRKYTEYQTNCRLSL